MRVLLTGFEPFGAHRVNPSLLVAERLGGVILPVSRARAGRAAHAGRG
jgi:pyrrolidone-carboxylate peptidase